MAESVSGQKKLTDRINPKDVAVSGAVGLVPGFLVGAEFVLSTGGKPSWVVLMPVWWILVSGLIHRHPGTWRKVGVGLQYLAYVVYMSSLSVVCWVVSRMAESGSNVEAVVGGVFGLGMILSVAVVSIPVGTALYLIGDRIQIG